jgi:hypothetical protein
LSEGVEDLPRPLADRAEQIRWFTWLSETARTSGVNLTHEGVKRLVLHVEHLAEWRGTVAEAQRAVLDYVETALKDAGNPEQLGLLPADTPRKRGGERMYR